MSRRPKQYAAIEPSSGNVFADLGLMRPDLALAKAKALHGICRLVEEHRLSQAVIAAALGTKPKLINAILRGDAETVSLARLIQGLSALNRSL